MPNPPVRTEPDRRNWRAGAFALAVAVVFSLGIGLVFAHAESQALGATIVAVLSGVCGAVVLYGVWREWWRSCLLWVALLLLVPTLSLLVVAATAEPFLT